jgi:flagellar L-ring protein precursor FlgH
VLVVTFAAPVLASGCIGPKEITREPRVRDYKPAYKVDLEAAKPPEGGLYSEMGPVHDYYVDHRALRVGDIVTVVISEKSSAAGAAGTKLSKTSEYDAKIEALLGLMAQLDDKVPNFHSEKLVSAATEYAFKGDGSTTREGSLSATVTANVREVLPNGNLFIEGTKTILVNNEEQYFYLSGVIRPVDVGGDNTVPSDLIGDAQVEFTGQGVISDVAAPGWLAQALSWIWPF